MREMRKLRHWKQRYDPDAEFVFRRRVVWNGGTYESGERIPDDLAANKAKLRRFWESGWIELAEFEAPDVATGQPRIGVRGEVASSKPCEYAPDVGVSLEIPDDAPDVDAGRPSIPELPEGASMEKRGSWYVVTLADGSVHKTQGAAARDELIARLGEGA